MNKYIHSNRNDDYIYEIEKVLQDRKGEILDFFEVKDNETFSFNIYVYDTVEKLHEALNEKNIITNKLSYQTNENNALYFFEPDDCFKEKYKQKIFNEEIRGIENLIYGNHPRWLRDGIVMYINNIDIKTIIENININEYEEPYFSYIIVSYLIKKYTKPLFIRLIGLQNFIDFVENNNVFEEALNYYQNIYNVKVKYKKS